jgi:hypothetical protein
MGSFMIKVLFSVPLADQIRFCYSCGIKFNWEGGPNPYCGRCGARQFVSRPAVEALSTELTKGSVMIS